MKRTGRLRPVSPKRAQQLREYAALRIWFLSENPTCEVCGGRAHQVHHRRGRNGKRLLQTGWFMAVCFGCHRKITDNPEWALEMGYTLHKGKAIKW